MWNWKDRKTKGNEREFTDMISQGELKVIRTTEMIQIYF